MTLQQQIKKDLTFAMKARDEETKSTLRVVMGEFARSNKKELDDEAVIRVLKKLIKSEKETLGKQRAETSSPYIRTIEKYLPQIATEEDIVAWINEHIDFTEFKSKMQAMGPIMQHFGSRADGNTVKSILQKL
jgi:uncharacterized protein YqeY